MHRSTRRLLLRLLGWEPDPTALIICACLALLAFSGCTATGVRLNLAPLLDYELDRTTDSVRLSLLGPIIEYEATGEQSLFAIRPLFSRYNDPAHEATATHLLYPLVRHRTDGPDEQFTVLPLYNGQSYYDAQGRRDSDYMLFPFIWYGDGDAPLDNYFAVFPFGGTINGMLGLDEFEFILFPLYAKSRFRERLRTHIVWPIYNITNCPTEEGIRCWPFWGSFEKYGEFETSFLLWPFYSTETTGMDTDTPTETTSYFPLYLRSDSAYAWTRGYLLFFTFGHDDRTDFNSVSFPWPLVIFESSDNHTLKRVWPFWSYQSRGGVETSTLAFPFIWWGTETTANWTKKSNWVLPLFWQHHKQFFDTDAYESHTKLWPLLGYWHDKDGTERVKALSLFWFEDPTGFDRDWSPLWEIYRSESHPDNRSRTDFLWGFIRHDRSEDKTVTDITPLFRYNSHPDGGGVSLLQGLLGIQTDRQGTHLQLLWFIEI